MKRFLPIRLAVPLCTALLLTACAERPLAPNVLNDETVPLLSRAADHSSVVVNWHPQQQFTGRTGPVAGASASLLRTNNGISFRMSTTQLTPGNAYTLWLAVVNNPSACAAHPMPCTALDLFNDATHTQVRFAAGHVAGEAGRGVFAGAAQEGSLTGWLPNRMFSDSKAVEVHLVINDHGPMLPDHMPGMIRTYRGGCADRPQSPFPPMFPQSALDDGQPGPNTCRLYQAAIFTAP